MKTAQLKELLAADEAYEDSTSDFSDFIICPSTEKLIKFLTNKEDFDETSISRRTRTRKSNSDSDVLKRRYSTSELPDNINQNESFSYYLFF